jgi:nitric oxide reductase NorD protein
MDRRPGVRTPADDEDDERPGMWMVQLDDPQEHVEDPMGLQRPTDREEDADAAELADSLSELPEARLVSTPGSVREVLASEDPPEHSAAEAPAPDAETLSYPEWDYRAGAYVVPGASVRLRPAPLGAAGWAAGVRERQAALSRAVRRRFERLRPRRQRLGRQPDGAEVDLDAWVTARADAAAGRPPDERLYEAVRPARRDVAVGLLVDASASTDAWVGGSLRIVDVEKEALLVVCDALDALGDPYAIWSFSGEGPADVTVRTLRGFDDRDRALVGRRIAALEPDRYTRIGAAIRHATAQLAARPVRHRLLLVLSDGRPNDVDVYEGRYGIEDARRAVAEARMLGVHPFCLTVDREAPSYLPRMFGDAFTVLRNAERLPVALVDVLRALVSG